MASTNTNTNAPKLNQIIAVEKGLKSKDYGDWTKIYQLFQKTEPLKGLARTYQPRAEDGDKLPAEHVEVRVRVKDIVKDVQSKVAELFDITATKDWANCGAFADIVLDADTEKPTTLLEKVPVTYLLWLEKQLEYVYAFISKLPTLPADTDWKWDENKNCFKSDPAVNVKTKKTIKPLVMYEATKEHPAQIEKLSEDIPVGDWTTINFHGGLPAQTVAEMKERVKKLQVAVKFARETANTIPAPKQKVGEKVLSFVFDGQS
jgi:hypothetical protein